MLFFNFLTKVKPFAAAVALLFATGIFVAGLLLVSGIFVDVFGSDSTKVVVYAGRVQRNSILCGPTMTAPRE